MDMPKRMKFGSFLGPFHRVGENPTLAMDRDLELIDWMDNLGFDEVWIGEHHSAGWEIISSPEVFIAAASQRTRYIKLGTGVVSLPYHHPLMVANRMVQLDHMSRGRVLFGVGPGALPGDAYMMGIPHETQRERMDESLGIIMRLFTETEPITYKSDWFELNEGMLQLRPYQQPYMPVAVASIQTPAGVALAGKHGASVLTITVPRDPSAGPAGLVMTDGRYAVCMLDRNGLRPARWVITKNGFITLSSEIGVYSYQPEDVVAKGRVVRVLLKGTAGFFLLLFDLDSDLEGSLFPFPGDSRGVSHGFSADSGVLGTLSRTRNATRSSTRRRRAPLPWNQNGSLAPGPYPSRL